MKINCLSGLLRIILNSIAVTVIIFASLGLILNLLINEEILSTAYIVVFIIIFAVKILGECFLIVLDRHSSSALLFDSDFITYKGRKYSIGNLSLKYFKFHWTFLGSDLVIPKLVISIPNSQNIICYITKRQIQKLRNEMKYKIINV